MKKTARQIIVAIFTLMSADANAADEAGRFNHRGGVGTVQCVEFVSAMEQARRHKYHSPEYWRSIDSFVAFAAGFQTGFNYGWLGRQDISRDGILSGY
jgi:hypothetical protein